MRAYQVVYFVSAVLALAASAPATAQDACRQRGELDQLYCDENDDLDAQDSGTPFDQAGFDKQRAREEAAKKK